MINLIVMSKQQELLNGFFDSLFPTIQDDVEIYVLSKGLDLPADRRVHEVPMPEFNPNKYFNQVAKRIGDRREIIGIVNDDIIFSSGWLEDVKRNLKKFTCVSPGFIETKNKAKFDHRMWETQNEVAVYEGIFDAFYVFPAYLVDLLGKFDEDIVEWYDIDWYLRMKDAEIDTIVSKRVTVMHLKRATFALNEPDKAKIKREILKKHGKEGLNRAKMSWKIRKHFNE